MVLHVRAHYMCPLWNFLSPLLQSTWPLMHHLQQQRHHSGHRLLKHSSLLLYFSPLALFEPLLTSYTFLFAHFASCVQFFWIQHSCFPEIVHIISASPPSIITFCFYSVQVFCFPKAQLHFFSPIRWFPTSCNKAINLQHINQCRNVSLLTD